MKQLAIITDEGSLVVDRAIASFLGEHHIGFWHRVPNVWLLVVEDGKDLQTLRQDIVRATGASPNCIALEVSNWSAFAPKEWLEWFSNHWGGGEPIRHIMEPSQGDVQAAGVNAA